MNNFNQYNDFHESNKLIAKFMGLKYYPQTTYSPGGLEPDQLLQEEWRERDTHGKLKIKYYKLRYNEEWEWLMPVLTKISELSSIQHNNIEIDVTIKMPVEVYIKASSEGRAFRFERNTSGNLFDHIYEAVVKFIEWYAK